MPEFIVHTIPGSPFARAVLAATPEWAPLTAAHPNLVAWLARMNARPSMQATTWEKVSAMAKAG